MFDIKKFNSGEWDVVLNQRIHNPKRITVKWNWFTHPDIMMPLMQIDAINRNYCDPLIYLQCNYLPYSRQDRLFNVGGSVPLAILLKIFEDVHIEVMGLHADVDINNHIYDLSDFDSEDSTFVFPDKNAVKHYNDPRNYYSIIFNKVRENNAVKLEMERYYYGSELAVSLNHPKKIVICDDICDGGRTFVECAKYLKQLNPQIDHIELMVYHAFMTHGLEDLKEAGIKLIRILNPDSYEHIINKYTNDKDYFYLQPFSDEDCNS